MAHRSVRIDLHQVEEDVERTAPHIPLIFLFELLGQITDLGVLEEVECGVDVFDVDEALRTGRSLLHYLRFPGRSAHPILLDFSRDLRDSSAAVANEEVDEAELEVL